MTTHGYALNVDLDPAPFTEWITACGLEGAAFTTMARELERPVSVDEVRAGAAAALEQVFGLTFEDLPSTVCYLPAARRGTPPLDWTRCRARCPSLNGPAARSG